MPAGTMPFREQQAWANAAVTPLPASTGVEVLIQLNDASQLPNAANDAAAAALSPPVAVNSLYRNGSVLMIRVS